MIVVGNHVIESSLRLQCRQRERYGLRPLIQKVARERGAHWSSVPLGSLERRRRAVPRRRRHAAERL